MIIAAAQIKLDKGINQDGLDRHIVFIKKAIEKNVKLIIFPELSLSGYEPSIIHENLLNTTDPRLDIIKHLSRTGNIIISLGAPLLREHGVEIAAFLFYPSGEIKTYSKQYLHDSENKYFVPGRLTNKISIGEATATYAICYEAKVEAHMNQSLKHLPEFHLVSVVEDNIDKTIGVMSEFAKAHHLPILIVNCVGESGGYNCNGGSCFLSKEGNIMSQLDNKEEGLLVVDLE